MYSRKRGEKKRTNEGCEGEGASRVEWLLLSRMSKCRQQPGSTNKKERKERKQTKGKEKRMTIEANNRIALGRTGKKKKQSE